MTHNNLIGDKWQPALSGKTIPVINPATGDRLAVVPDSDASDIDAAVAAARASYESGSWRKMDPSQRERVLWRIAELIDQYEDQLCLLESQENGKTVREAHGADIRPSADAFRYYAGWIRRPHGETIPVDGPYLNYTLREPVGVVGQIVPWNYPFLLASWKVAPALACGCSIVLKPSELTPLTAMCLGEICHEAGLPPGVLNIVTGYGPTAGDALARHMDVDKLSFTGSVRTARSLLRASGESNLKRVSLELGGKSPNIIFADADLDAAVSSAFKAIFDNKGEVCSAGSRLLIESKVHDEFVSRLVERARKMKVGNPLDPATEMGSLISQTQMDRVLGYIQSGIEQKATLACGGARDTTGDNARGFFVQPTVFTGVRTEMKIAQEEIFGPVLSVLKFEDEQKAISIANGTIYGLVSAVWTRDITRAHWMAERIKAGSVWINTYNGFDSASPFGGYKQSGFGRDLGGYALEQYTQVKSVWIGL